MGPLDKEMAGPSLDRPARWCVLLFVEIRVALCAELIEFFEGPLRRQLLSPFIRVLIC